MNDEEISAELAAARTEYMRAADNLLKKIRLEFGGGVEGFEVPLNNRQKGVDNLPEDQARFIESQMMGPFFQDTVWPTDRETQ